MSGGLTPKPATIFMKCSIWNADWEDKTYYLTFKRNEKFEEAIDDFVFVKDATGIKAYNIPKNDKELLLRFASLRIDKKQVNRKYALTFTPSDGRFDLKALLTTREAKAIAKEYGFRWDFDKFNNSTFVWCICGMNLDCPTYGEVLKVPVDDLSDKAKKRLNKHQYCEDKHFALVNANWMKVRYEFEEDGVTYKNQGWKIPQQYGKPQVCPWCKIGFEVQDAYKSCPLHLRVLERFWTWFDFKVMVPYMHLFGDYPKWWINREKQAF